MSGAEASKTMHAVLMLWAESGCAHFHSQNCEAVRAMDGNADGMIEGTVSLSLMLRQGASQRSSLPAPERRVTFRQAEETAPELELR